MSVVARQEPECPSKGWQEGGARQAVAMQAGGAPGSAETQVCLVLSESGRFGLLRVLQMKESC